MNFLGQGTKVAILSDFLDPSPNRFLRPLEGKRFPGRQRTLGITIPEQNWTEFFAAACDHLLENKSALQLMAISGYWSEVRRIRGEADGELPRQEDSSDRG